MRCGYKLQNLIFHTQKLTLTIIVNTLTTKKNVVVQIYTVD